VSEGASIFAEDHHDRIDIVVSDVMDTLLLRSGPWRAYEKFLIWLEDTGHHVVLVSSDPDGTKHKMLLEGCHPRLLEKDIERKDIFFMQSRDRGANIAVAIDDTTTFLITQHVAHIVNPFNPRFRQFVENELYLRTEPVALLEARPDAHIS
jgi:hypothetical protein